MFQNWLNAAGLAGGQQNPAIQKKTPYEGMQDLQAGQILSTGDVTTGGTVAQQPDRGRQRVRQRIRKRKAREAAGLPAPTMQEAVPGGWGRPSFMGPMAGQFANQFGPIQGMNQGPQPVAPGRGPEPLTTRPNVGGWGIFGGGRG